jgi:tetratricopeptide (TPR) repeat protein
LNSRTLHFILAAFLVVSLPARACINEVGTNHRGQEVHPLYTAGQRLQSQLITTADKSELITWSGQVVEKAREKPAFDSLNNLAAVLVRFGRLEKAASLLRFLERKYPGRYETAANLGTTYELMGRNEDALKWISEGLKRNPEDHRGTEWLHVHILKTKLGRLPKPAPGLSILNLDFGNELMPGRPPRLPAGNAGKPLTLFDVAQALRYQLIERIEFVAAPDPMIAGLLLDWANLELLAGTVESADVLYDAAARYGSSEGRTIAIRKSQVGRILAQAKAEPSHLEGRCELCEPPPVAISKQY